MLKDKSASAVREQFVGTWSLVSFEFRRSDGTVTNVMGTDATGVLIYDANGRVSAQMMRADRPRFASGDQQKGTADEMRAAFEGYLAYFGDYDVDEKERTVIHHTQAALFPNLVGQDQKRFYEFAENRLTLTTPPIVVGGVSVTGILVWERAS
jgi:Lipocalin-like domain